MIQYHSCCVFVKEIARSRDFYEALLGQIAEMDYGRCIAYAGGFSIMERGYAAGVVHGPGADPGSGQGTLPFELYFETHELEAAEERLKQAGATFIHEVKEQPWMQRCLRIADPDGHIVEVAEPMFNVIRRLIVEGMPPAEVADKTGMPQELCEAFTGRGNFGSCDCE